LRRYLARHGVIRITTLFLVLTVTGLPSAGPLCIAWCDDHWGSEATAAGCHHQTTTEGAPVAITGIQGCETPVQYMPFVREDVQPVSAGWLPSHAAVWIVSGDEPSQMGTVAGALVMSGFVAPPTSIAVLRL
jgi:hypothetical protein